MYVKQGFGPGFSISTKGRSTCIIFYPYFILKKSLSEFLTQIKSKEIIDSLNGIGVDFGRVLFELPEENC